MRVFESWGFFLVIFVDSSFTDFLYNQTRVGKFFGLFYSSVIEFLCNHTGLVFSLVAQKETAFYENYESSWILGVLFSNFFYSSFTDFLSNQTELAFSLVTKKTEFKETIRYLESWGFSLVNLFCFILLSLIFSATKQG